MNINEGLGAFVESALDKKAYITWACGAYLPVVNIIRYFESVHAFVQSVL